MRKDWSIRRRRENPPIKLAPIKAPTDSLKELEFLSDKA